MSTNFYIPPDQIRGDRATLSGDEVRHVSKVLRIGLDDEITAVDGVGGWYRIVLDHINRRAATGRIIEYREGVGEPSFELTLAFALIKRRSRFETFLEKAVELGVSTIAPIVTARTEKEEIRETRSGKVLIAAMKQCGRSRLPHLSDPVPFKTFLKTDYESAGNDLKLLFHEGAGPEFAIANVLAQDHMGDGVIALIGPEGGFTEDEVETAVNLGYRVVSLGPRRLRAETAAIVASAAIMLTFERG